MSAVTVNVDLILADHFRNVWWTMFTRRPNQRLRCPRMPCRRSKTGRLVILTCCQPGCGKWRFGSKRAIKDFQLVLGILKNFYSIKYYVFYQYLALWIKWKLLNKKTVYFNGKDRAWGYFCANQARLIKLGYSWHRAIVNDSAIQK